MKQNTFSGEYLAPQVKVVETKIRGVLCSSPVESGNDGYNSTDYEW